MCDKMHEQQNPQRERLPRPLHGTGPPTSGQPHQSTVGSLGEPTVEMVLTGLGSQVGTQSLGLDEFGAGGHHRGRIAGDNNVVEISGVVAQVRP